MVNSNGISFVVPAHNEAGAIEQTLTRLKDVLSKQNLSYEIILVDDGSDDETSELASKIPNVKTIRHPVNIGYGNSLKHGIAEANFNWIGIVDADGTYPIEDLPVLLEEMRKGYHMVIASRSNLEEIDSLPKKLFRKAFKTAINVLNDSKIDDPNSGYRIFQKDLALELMPFLCGTFSFTTSFTILASGLYYFIKFVPLKYEKRVGTSKVRHFRDSIRTLQFIVQGITFFNPLKFFVLLSLLTFAFVCVPAIALAVWDHKYLSLAYLIVGVATGLMIGMAGLGDIIRISAAKLQNGNNKIT